MNIVGIIAEYNPFHRGHAWHLAEARRRTDAAYTVVVMSGNYVQRGAPAMFDKYSRARAALKNGADLILELPPCVSTGSAEYFAAGAVGLLTATGIVTDLCFGSECGDLDRLLKPAHILAQEPEAFRQYLKEALRLGMSWPKARAWALGRYDRTIPQETLEHPNDLLALEYLKALERSHSPVRPHTVRRIGAHYHEARLCPEQTAAASGIRKALLQSQGIFTPELLVQLPSPEVYEAYRGKTPITEDAFSLLLLERLWRHPSVSLNAFFGVTKELSGRIRRHQEHFSSFSQFTDLLKTRNLTRTAVSRGLLHIMLNIRNDQPAGVFRVLGFRKNAEPLLKELTKQGTFSLVTSPSDEVLPEDWLYADRLYESVRALLHGQPYENEHRRKLLVL